MLVINGFFGKGLRNKWVFKFSNLMDVKKEHALLKFIRNEYLEPFQLSSELEKLLENEYIEDVAVKSEKINSYDLNLKF